MFNSMSHLDKSFNASLFEDLVERHACAAFQQFKQISRSYAFFHLIFFFLALVEVLSLLLFFSFFAKSTLLAFVLAGIFLTAFSYFLLLFYFQAKKPEQFSQLETTYVAKCKEVLPFEKSSAEYHLSTVHAIYRLLSLLHTQEKHYYPLPETFSSLKTVLEKFSIWAHWKDVHQMEEMLLFDAIQEHIDLIKKSPIDLEAHASLARAYLRLAALYKAPENSVWIPPEYFSEEMEKQYKAATEKALEEFRILDYFAPGDLWVHSQLAAIYRDLNLLSQELTIYETITRLAPHDKEAQLKLGILYFKQGKHAEGLRIYEAFKNASDSRAEELIAYYG